MKRLHLLITRILMAITHTPIVIMVLGRGVQVTGVMVDGVIMVLGVRVTGVMGGIADKTFFGQLDYLLTVGKGL